MIHPSTSIEQHDALTKALLGLARLPRVTKGLTVDFGFSVKQRDEELLHWSVHLDETEIMWTAGGYLNGPCGPDSFTLFQLSLFVGSEDIPIRD